MSNDPTTGGSGDWFTRNKRAIIIGSSMVGIAAIVVIIVALVLANGDDEDDDQASPDASPSASASASVSATASPSPEESATPEGSATATAPATTTATATAAPDQMEWTVNVPQPMPPSSVVTIEHNCYQCDAASEGFERVAAFGQPGSEPQRLELLPSPDGGYISSTYVSPRGDQMWVTVCSEGNCGPLGEVSNDAASVLSHSTDGGVTWSDVETFDGAVGVAGVSAGIPVMARFEGSDVSYFALGGNEIEPPEDGAAPVYLANGPELVWLSVDFKKLMDTGGDVIFESDRPFSVSGSPRPSGGAYFIRFISNSTTPIGYALVEGGDIVQEYVEPFFITIGGWIDDRTVVGNADLAAVDIPGVTEGEVHGLTPVLIDLESGAITPIEVFGPLSEPDAYGGINLIRSLDRGIEEATTPYLVVTPDDCLNVRDTPSQSAAVVQCWADGVILWVPGTEPVEAEGITWIPVVGPDTSRGWASSEFLQP